MLHALLLYDRGALCICCCWGCYSACFLQGAYDTNSVLVTAYKVQVSYSMWLQSNIIYKFTYKKRNYLIATISMHLYIIVK